jgi:exonuclease VII small subunit
MQELGETVPGFTETAEAIHEVLARTAVDPAQVRMITPRIRYTETVTRVEIRVLGQTEEEAIWLAGVMPGLFQNFLIEEELALRLGEYETDLTNSKVVENDLVDARRHLALLPYGGNSTYGDLQASRFEIEAIITALEEQAAIVAGELASITAEGLTGTYEYERTLSQLRRLTQKLAEARIELDRVNAELQGGNANAEHAVAYARVRMLSEQLDAISERLASPPTVEGVEAHLQDLFLAYDPSLPIMVTEKMRGRNALMIGAVLGVGVAWLGLNRKGLLERLRPSQATASFELPEEEEREDEA